MVVDKVITQKEQLDIVGATLLSIEEAEKLPLGLREYGPCFWWLLSPLRDDFLVACIDGDDGSYDLGVYVCENEIAVRPALQINNLNSSNFQIGDRFVFGKKLFQIISDNLAFCLEDIGDCCFRKNWRAEDANVYEKSDVKKFIDDWFNKSVQENDYPCKYFDEREEEVYLTDFQKGILFARTGKHIDYIYKTVGRCRGTKDMEMCNCDGDRSRCDFHVS